MDITGITVNNSSLGRVRHPFYTVLIKPLGQLGFDADQLMRGDEITCDELEALRIIWGYPVPEEYSELHEGWGYVWDIGAGVFTVTTDSHASTIRTGIRTISDLAVSVDVFESAQFIIKLSAAYDFDVFLVARKVVENKVSTLLGYRWGEADAYLSAVFHALFGRMLLRIPENDSVIDGGNQLIVIDQGELYDGEYQMRSLLLAVIQDLAQNGQYPNNLRPGQQGIHGQRQAVAHQGLLAQGGDLLTIYLFAAKLLNGEQPVFEPWMLYNIFVWFVQGREVESRNRTFDLSPWWG